MTLEEIMIIINDAKEGYIEIEGKDFKNIEIKSIKNAIRFYNCNFYNCEFKDNYAGSIHIKNCRFENCEFKNLKDDDTYIEIEKIACINCNFKDINLVSYEQTSIVLDKFNSCNFENIRLCFSGVEMSINNYDSKMKDCYIAVAKIEEMEWKNCELTKCTMWGYIADNKFENLKIFDTEIKGELKNNECINCTLDGKKFVLEDNV